MKLIFSSQGDGTLLQHQPGVCLQPGKLLYPLQKEADWHTKLRSSAVERETMHLLEAITLLQKQELLNNSIPLLYLAQSAPRRKNNDGPRHNYERDWGWAWRWGNMSVVDVVSDVHHFYPHHILGMVGGETSYGGVVH
jgi:hypothetical protein